MMFLSSSVMLLGAVSSGTVLGFSSPLIPGIQNDSNANIKVGNTEASWIGVCLYFF